MRTIIIGDVHGCDRELRALGFYTTDSAANFLFARHERLDGEQLYLRLKQQGVLIRHFSREDIRDFNRITVGSAEQINILIEKIKEILKKIQDIERLISKVVIGSANPRDMIALANSYVCSGHSNCSRCPVFLSLLSFSFI